MRSRSTHWRRACLAAAGLRGNAWFEEAFLGEGARPDLPHCGAGETICKPMLAAVANAVLDATGVRIRRVPLTPGRVLAALRA